ncbi:Scr1 family TA system antitoxin-like transcriptional regulator [Actinoplanes sp. CA-054009]
MHEAIDARLARQELLWYEGKKFEFIMLESALWSFPGSKSVQLAQLNKIMQLATRTNIKVGIVPHRSPLPLILTGFTVFDDRYVSAENIASEVVAIGPDSIRAYLRTFRQLEAVADFEGLETRIGKIIEGIEQQA